MRRRNFGWSGGGGGCGHHMRTFNALNGNSFAAHSLRRHGGYEPQIHRAVAIDENGTVTETPGPGQPGYGTMQNTQRWTCGCSRTTGPRGIQQHPCNGPIANCKSGWGGDPAAPGGGGRGGRGGRGHTNGPPLVWPCGCMGWNSQGNVIIQVDCNSPNCDRKRGSGPRPGPRPGPSPGPYRPCPCPVYKPSKCSKKKSSCCTTKKSSCGYTKNSCPPPKPTPSCPPYPPQPYPWYKPSSCSKKKSSGCSKRSKMKWMPSSYCGTGRWYGEE